MKSKLALLLASLLFFNIILPTKVFASSVQDQSKPIFGLTADQVVYKYNQLSDQQKDQVLRALGNTSIFANSLFGNIFNSTFGVVNDAVKKLGDLFFQANGVVYKLGSSALAWISRLIDKVFNNDLSELNISQPVINDIYINTRGLNYISEPFFTQPNYPAFIPSSAWGYVFPLPSGYKQVFCLNKGTFYRYYYSVNCLNSTNINNYFYGLIVDLDLHSIYMGTVATSLNNFNEIVVANKTKGACFSYARSFQDNGQPYGDWFFYGDGAQTSSFLETSFSGDAYISSLKSFLNNYYVYCDSYLLISNNILTQVSINSSPETINVTNNTYYNYIYNIPEHTPLNVTNIVSNTSINYDPVENLIQYLPDNYNIEQNFSVVNNYYISSGSAITGQAIDVNIVSPGVIDVRITNPEDISQEVTNTISKDLILNFDLDYGDLVLEPKLEVNLNQNLNSIKPEVTSSGGIVSGFAGGIPPDLFKIITVLFGISLLVACLYHGSN